MCLVRQHRRRQLIERMQRDYLIRQDVDDEEDQDDYFACELGLRYPVLQAACRRNLLHIRMKVSASKKLTHLILVYFNLL